MHEKDIKTKFEEIINSIQLEKIDFPQYTLPDWLPDGIKQIIEYIAGLCEVANNEQTRKIFDSYKLLVGYFTFVLPVFIDPSMKEMWLKLDKISDETTKKFAQAILLMQNEFEGAISMYYKHIAEKECFAKILKKCQELQELICEYHGYYGHMYTTQLDILENAIDRFQKKSTQKLQKFEECTKDISYLNSDYHTITREFQSDSALPVFFVKKISLFFKQEFHKPFNRYVAEIISLLFDKHYSENDIIKITKTINKFVKGENS